jgi:two-component system OmpR family response regulator
MRILIVEDDKDISALLERSFREGSFSVDVAEDGEKGSFLARTNAYDIIVLDNLLPKKNGIDVCREIRAAGKTVPILMLSAIQEPAVKTEGLNAGADDYLAKPFSFDELFARIRALLRRPKEITGEILNTHDLSLNTKTHTVCRAKKEIHLSPKEFSLLEYLLRNKGAVLSRSMILEHVWDMAIDPFSNTIESHIASLRRKIDRDGQKSIIQTVPGIGYKIP